MDFTHLHVHSVYSLLDGLAKPEDLVAGAKELGMRSLAITDHGSITGSIRFLKACSKEGVNPILGIEAYYVNDATVKVKGEDRYHVVLLAKSNTGFRSLCRLMSKAHQNFYYVPRIDFHMLDDTEDLIVLTACQTGLVSHPDYESLIPKFRNRFEDDFYLEVMPIATHGQKVVNLRVENFFRQGYKVVATNDVHYVSEWDHKFHSFLLSLNTKGKMQFDIEGLYLGSPEAVREGFTKRTDLPLKLLDQAMERTAEVADKVSLEMPPSQIILPHIMDGDSSENLQLAAWTCLDERLNGAPKDVKQVYEDRLEYELDVLEKKGFSDYFLLVDDLVRWARERDMELGAGRGSAGGSLVCYVLGITDVDPIENDLIFERFLNPERIDYPDIDLDFPKSRRGEVFEYLHGRYGEDRVANIATFSELKSRSAFKDVARYFGVPFLQANAVSELLDNERSIRGLIEEDQDVRKAVQDVENWEEVVEYADGIVGTLRHGGVHAAGVVISPVPIEDRAVLEKRKDDYCVNWEMGDVDYFGWVKLDVLALRTLDIIAEAKRLIYTSYGDEIEWDKIKVDTPDVLREFGLGNTIGTFQFESNLMRQLLIQLHPITSKNTLVDANALGRPGPLDSGMTEEYVRKYRALLKGRYLDFGVSNPYGSFTEPICKDTQNVIIYQEQIMRIATDLAGYTVPESDILRKIVAKSKGEEEFQKHKERFIQGCIEISGMSAEIAELLFNDLGKYSRYSFNKSHAACYTELALRQQWLKIHYPLQYMAALLSHTDNKEKKRAFIDEAARLKIPILSPDINESKSDFKLDGAGILIGLSSIKGVGPSVVESILEERKKGDFKNIEDFRVRLSKKDVNKSVFTALISSDCFSSLGVSMKSALSQVDGYFEKVLKHYQAGKGPKPACPDSVYNWRADFPADQKDEIKARFLEGVYVPQREPELGLVIDGIRLIKLQEEIAGCTECSLIEPYRAPVPFDFSEKSRLFIVAEAPGKDEVEHNSPLVGKAGKYLFKRLSSIGIEREKCFITNIYKCRPENNKLPNNPPKACHKWIREEIRLTQPDLIVCFGKPASEFMAGRPVPIKKATGTITVEQVEGRSIPVLFSVHPAMVLHSNYQDEHLFDLAIEKIKEVIGVIG